MSEPKLPRISYAQNFEDIILWRALGDVDAGCYVDIGAQSPATDSVSRVFYEQGWRGVHVEPTPHYAAQLREHRPGEIVLQALVSEKAGLRRFFEIAGTGLSTLDEQIARVHEASGFEVRESLVPAMTMDALLEQVGEREIHWLKIDVEGAEYSVLQGWKAAPQRPWILVIESTRPLSREQAHQKWEPLVLEKGYEFAYFDGLNRFYVSVDRLHLLAAFDAGPNVFDGFSLASSSEFCASVNVAYHALEQRRESEEAAAHASLVDIQARLDVERAEVRRLGVEKLAHRAQYESLVQEARQQAEAEQARCEELTETLLLREVDVAKLSAAAQIERARIAGLRDAHLAQIDRFQSHVAWLDGVAEGYRIDSQSARSRADDALHDAHRWWMEAERLRHELARIESSLSWRMTAPMRGARRLASSLVRSPIQASKQIARPMVVGGMRTVLAVPSLRAITLRLLGLHPGIKARLRALAQHAGLIEAPDDAVDQSQCPLPRSAPGGLTNTKLQVRADQVLADLRHAIQEKHG